MIISLIGSLNNGMEGCVLTDEGDISNYLGLNIKIIIKMHLNISNHTRWIK